MHFYEGILVREDDDAVMVCDDASRLSPKRYRALSTGRPHPTPLLRPPTSDLPLPSPALSIHP